MKSSQFIGIVVVSLIVIFAVVGIVREVNSPKVRVQSQMSENSKPETSIEEVKHKWKYTENVNEMDDSKIYHAILRADNILNFKFPYNGGTDVSLQVRYMEGANNVIFIISQGQIVSKSVRVRFDDHPAQVFSCSESRDYSSNALYINNSKEFINNLKESKRLIIECEYFKEGLKHSKFTTEGLEWNH